LYPGKCPRQNAPNLSSLGPPGALHAIASQLAVTRSPFQEESESF
jgi:hypothetical protein